MVRPVIHLGIDTPECGWLPLLDWCDEQGLDATRIRYIDVIDEGQCLVTEYVLDDNGRRQLDPADPTEPWVRQRAVFTSSPPPLNRP